MFNILLTLAIGYELQKLIQFNFFFKLRSLTSDYANQIKTRINSVIFKELLKISFVDLGYLLIVIFGLYTINLYFFFCITILALIQNLVFKTIKNKTIRKVSFTIDILLSIILLLLSLINSMYYHLDSIQLIKQLF